MAIEITKANFEAEVLQSDKPVLVDFWADWCGPCKMLAPVLDKLSQERTDIKIGKINVDQQQELASQFNVMSIPTVVAFKAGKEVARSVGLVPQEKLEALV